MRDRKKLYIILTYMIIFIICLFAKKQDVKADGKQADFEKEIEEQGYGSRVDRKSR